MLYLPPALKLPWMPGERWGRLKNEEIPSLPHQWEIFSLWLCSAALAVSIKALHLKASEPGTTKASWRIPGCCLFSRSSICPHQKQVFCSSLPGMKISIQPHLAQGDALQDLPSLYGRRGGALAEQESGCFARRSPGFRPGANWESCCQPVFPGAS